MFGSDRNRINCSVLSVGMIMVMTIGLYSIFYSIALFYSVIFFIDTFLLFCCSILFYSIVLFYSVIFYIDTFCFLLFCCSILFCFILFCFPVHIMVFFPIWLCAVLFSLMLCVCVCVCVCVRARAQ